MRKDEEYNCDLPIDKSSLISLTQVYSNCHIYVPLHHVGVYRNPLRAGIKRLSRPLHVCEVRYIRNKIMTTTLNEQRLLEHRESI